jgi:hypothetical protein
VSRKPGQVHPPVHARVVTGKQPGVFDAIRPQLTPEAAGYRIRGRAPQPTRLLGSSAGNPTVQAETVGRADRAVLRSRFARVPIVLGCVRQMPDSCRLLLPLVIRASGLRELSRCCRSSLASASQGPIKIAKAATRGPDACFLVGVRPMGQRRASTLEPRLSEQLRCLASVSKDTSSAALLEPRRRWLCRTDA